MQKKAKGLTWLSQVILYYSFLLEKSKPTRNYTLNPLECQGTQKPPFGGQWSAFFSHSCSRVKREIMYARYYYQEYVSDNILAKTRKSVNCGGRWGS